MVLSMVPFVCLTSLRALYGLCPVMPFFGLVKLRIELPLILSRWPVRLVGLCYYLFHAAVVALLI